MIITNPTWATGSSQPNDHNSRLAVGEGAPGGLTLRTPRSQPRASRPAAQHPQTRACHPVPSPPGLSLPQPPIPRDPASATPSPALGLLPGTPSPPPTCASPSSPHHTEQSPPARGANTAPSCPPGPTIGSCPPTRQGWPHAPAGGHGATPPPGPCPLHTHPATQPAPTHRRRQPLPGAATTKGGTGRKANFIKLLCRTPGRGAAVGLPARSFSPSSGGQGKERRPSVHPSVPAWGADAGSGLLTIAALGSCGVIA